MAKPESGFDPMDPANVSPLVVWLASELMFFAGLFAAYSAHAQSNAATDAAGISAASTSKALDYEKQAAADALAYQKAADDYNRRYQASRDSQGDATLAQARADRGPQRVAGQGAATTLGSLLSPGQRVNGNTGMVSYADGSAPQSIGDLVKARSQVQPIVGAVAPPALAPVTPQTVTLYAPTGEPMNVSADRVDEALGKGATRTPPASAGNITAPPAGGINPVAPVKGF